jgi:hypothetical protein
MITVTYSTTDLFRRRESFETLADARKFAQHWLGKYPAFIGSTYAVSGDGSRITVTGANLNDLFGESDESKSG